MQTNETGLHPSKDASDGLLAERTLAGDQEAFALLVHRYRPWLLAFSCRLTHNATEAEDIVQFVFLKLYLALPTMRLDESLKPWLFQVARNRCYDEVHRRRAWSFSELEERRDNDLFPDLMVLLDPQPSPEDLAEQQELQSCIHRAICALPSKFRAIAILRYTGQLSYAEIAQTLHIPVATAKTYMHRAKPLLRAALDAKQE